MLRSVSLLVALSVSSFAFAQDSSEHVTVTGSKIWPPVGPVWAAEGPNPAPGHGCAEPNCGELPKEPGGGSGVTTEKQKEQQNKTAKEKAKAAAQTIWTAAKGALEYMKTVRAWLNGFTYQEHESEIESYDANGNKNVKRCRDLRVTALGGTDKEPLPCTEIMGQPEQVQRANGTIENQLRLTFEIYEACYYEKKCGPKYYSIIAGSEAELSRLLNEMTGTTDF